MKVTICFTVLVEDLLTYNDSSALVAAHASERGMTICLDLRL